MDITREHITRIFDDIEQNDHLQRVRFYESNTAMIFSLDEREQFYFSWQYINSLYELGKHELILAEIDPIIEYVFLNDIEYLPTGTFEELLFKKAACYYNTFDFDKCISVSEQLVAINTDNQLYQSIAMKAHRSAFNLKSSGIRLTAILLIFSSSIVSATTWLMSSNVQSPSLLFTFLIIASPCLLALAILGGAHAYSYIRSIRLIRQLVQSKKLKR